MMLSFGPAENLARPPEHMTCEWLGLEDLR
jgi:hypothetical protein